jgi:hypothetical protein
MDEQTPWERAWLQLVADAHQEGRTRHLLGFRAALNRDPTLYSTFERFTMEAIAAGMERCSADFIYHRMRWFSRVETRQREDDFKLNNNYCMYFGRLFALMHPEHATLFQKRAKAQT